MKYFNYNEWNLPVNTIGLSANISSWAGTSGNVTCSIYNNSYIQFRCENAVNEFNAYNDTIVLTSTATDGSKIQLSTDGTNLYLNKKLKGATDWTTVWKK